MLVKMDKISLSIINFEIVVDKDIHCGQTYYYFRVK